MFQNLSFKAKAPRYLQRIMWKGYWINKSRINNCPTWQRGLDWAGTSDKELL